MTSSLLSFGGCRNQQQSSSPSADEYYYCSTLLGAGHETTVTALGWILFELATHPDEQRRLRDELYSVRPADHVDDTGTVNLDALPFLNAVIKVNPPHVCLTTL